MQLLCSGGATDAGTLDSRAEGATSCIELRLPAPQSRQAGEVQQTCTYEILDFLCADAPCVRQTADGRSVAPRPLTQSSCLRHTCAEVCTAPEKQDAVVRVDVFCAKCRDAKLLDDSKLDAARFLGGGIVSFWSLLSSCWSLLCSVSPVFCNHSSPFKPCPPPPPPLVPLLPFPPPPRTSPPPLPPGTTPSPPPPTSVKCGASSPASCLGVPCAGTASCTTSTPQCCCGSDCAQFGDCCSDRSACCLTREAAQERGHWPASSQGEKCGSVPPGQSCQSIACSGSKTCNLGQRAGAAVLQSDAPSGCCCDELCELMGDCCADKADCCGTSTNEPRRGQLVISRVETAAFSTERVTPRGINVARGVNTRTGVGLLVPQHDGAPRRVSSDPGGASRAAAWAPVAAPAPSEGDAAEQAEQET